MRILLTNDDGIGAPGLAVLERIVAAWAPDAEVWVVAPALEQSGVGHALTYVQPIRVHKHGDRRFSLEGTPADCVICALHELMDEAPNLILSGVNRGNNSAENALYSGTLGAAIEAGLQGVRGIALSAYLGPANMENGHPWEASAHFAAQALDQVLAASTDADGGLFWNINFPPVPAADVKGLRFAAQGTREGARFGAHAQTAPNGRRYLWVRGGDQRAPSAPGSDAAVNLDGYVSMTPMRVDLTDHELLGRLS